VLVDTLGYRWTFVAIAALNLLVIPLIRPVFGRGEDATEGTPG
jgi:predicted MFS family arabinose efflux permease